MARKQMTLATQNEGFELRRKRRTGSLTLTHNFVKNSSAA